MVDWDQIVVTYGAVVWRTAYRLLGRHDDALDCCQETFLAAYRARERGPIANWEAFLTSVATRQAIDRLRQRTRLRRRFSALADAPEPIAAACTPLEQAQEAERLEQVRQFLSRLPAKQRNDIGQGQARRSRRHYLLGEGGNSQIHRLGQPSNEAAFADRTVVPRWRNGP